MIGALFDAAIATGAEVQVENADGHRGVLPVPAWNARPKGADTGLLDRCVGATLDIGLWTGTVRGGAGRAWR